MSKSMVKKKPGRGRPSKYKKEFCKKLIEHCAKGLDFRSFAAELKLNEETLINWANRYPEFLEAKKRGLDVAYSMMLKQGLMGMTGKINGFNVVVWIFMMKNRFGWRDKKEIEHSGQAITLNYGLDKKS